MYEVGRSESRGSDHVISCYQIGTKDVGQLGRRAASLRQSDRNQEAGFFLTAYLSFQVVAKFLAILLERWPGIYRRPDRFMNAELISVPGAAARQRRLRLYRLILH
jgi:hypothetical protein